MLACICLLCGNAPKKGTTLVVNSGKAINLFWAWLIGGDDSEMQLVQTENKCDITYLFVTSFTNKNHYWKNAQWKLFSAKPCIYLLQKSFGREEERIRLMDIHARLE